MTDHTHDLERVFSHRAFIPFVTCGDPDIETTEGLVRAMAEAGADLIELGIPFSDPIAEGPVIQGADVRALSSGVTTDDIFDMAERVRADLDVPMLVMTYINPVFVYGPDRFLERCRRAGICAIIVPDMPYEQKQDLQPYCTKHGVKLISMIAPTSEDRISMIASEAEGFIYIVSSMGVTGVRTSFSSNLEDMVAAVRRATDIPCAIGFGISTPEQARRMTDFADGAIVGSAIVRIIAEHGRDSVPYVAEYVRNMRAENSHRQDAGGPGVHRTQPLASGTDGVRAVRHRTH